MAATIGGKYGSHLEDSMSIKHSVKWISLIASVVLLTACSSNRQTGDDMNGFKTNRGSHVETSGLGSNSRFPGANAGRVNAETGEKYNTVYFNYDSNNILEQYMPMIRANATYLKENPNAQLRLEGNTDPRGSREYNIGLGQRRGNSVADALEMMGVPRNQFIVVSYGKEKLAVMGDNEEDYRLDRRVEMIYERN